MIKNKSRIIPPDIIFEQCLLYDMTKKLNYKVKTLVKNPLECDEINYQHVLSSVKWNHFEKIKNLLNYYAPDLYIKTIQKIENIIC